MSTENLIDPLAFLTSQQQYRIADLKASANSLNYGSFQPNHPQQENLHWDYPDKVTRSVWCPTAVRHQSFQVCWGRVKIKIT